MHYSAKKIRLSCDEPIVMAWADFLRSKPEEISQSLTEERVRHEQWHLGKDNAGLYLIGVMDVNFDDVKHSATVTRHSELSINKVHEEFKQHWLSREDVAIAPDKSPLFPNCRLLLDLKP